MIDIRAERERKPIDVPIIKNIVPIPYIAIGTVEIDFNVDVKDSSLDPKDDSYSHP